MYKSEWYNNLIKPFLTPPNWIFPIVWSVLYFLIILSLIFYIVADTNLSKKTGYIYFTIQMILNLIWSPIFFILKNIFLALIIVILLNIFIFLTIKNFYSVSKISAILLIPYFLWTLFAVYLNFSYLILNR